MAKRLTQNPFRVRGSVTESAANTLTEQSVDLPVAVIGQGKAQGIEVMKVVYSPGNDIVDMETAQTNRTVVAWHRDTVSSLDISDDDTIDIEQYSIVLELSTNGGGAASVQTVTIHDLTDGDGNGQIIVDRTIFLSIFGVGNAGAKNCQSYLLCHLVELSAEDVIIEAFLDDS